MSSERCLYCFRELVPFLNVSRFRCQVCRLDYRLSLDGVTLWTERGWDVAADMRARVERIFESRSSPWLPTTSHPLLALDEQLRKGAR